MTDICRDSLSERFELRDDGLYYKVDVYKTAIKAGTKAGSLVRDTLVIRYMSKDYYVKDLVYFYHHGYFSDYDLFNYDGDPSNNGILNLLEEGETLVRLNNGLRYDPATKIYYKRQYIGHSLHHQYIEVTP